MGNRGDFWPKGGSVFQGAAALNLDAKGRLAIPARQRELIAALPGSGFVLTAHPHQCLVLIPQDAWGPFRDKVLASSNLEMQSALVRRFFIGFAVDVELDSAGRLLVAPELRDLVKLDKKVWLVGQGSHFEIWSDAGWKAQQEAIFKLGDKLLPPGLENLSL